MSGDRPGRINWCTADANVFCCTPTNPALANKELYPYFLRTIPSDSLQVRPSSRPVLPSG